MASARIVVTVLVERMSIPSFRSIMNPISFKRTIYTTILLLFGTVVLYAQSAPVDTSSVLKGLRKESLFPLPIIYYTPETGWAAGLSLFSTFRMKGQTAQSRPSQAQVGFAYTQRKQLLFYLPFQIFPGSQKWQIYGELGYYRYTYQFFGIGNQTSIDDKENYDVNFPRVRVSVLRLIKPHHYIGLRYWWDDYHIVQTQENGLLEQGHITGYKGGVLSGAGLIYNFDSRDNLFYPTKGVLAEAEVLVNQRSLGSNFNFTRTSLDLAYYHAVSRKGIIACNLWLVFLGGNVPFQQLAFIGGPKKMRGFFEGRLRDKNLWMVQTEYRLSLPKRFVWVAFMGIGSVSPAPTNLFAQQLHFTYGSGIRFAISKKDRVNIRLDVASNELGEIAPYLTVKEAF